MSEDDDCCTLMAQIANPNFVLGDSVIWRFYGTQ